MVVRLFRMGLAKNKALERLGAAVLLNWSALPAHLQDQVVNQAIAMSSDDPAVHEQIERLTRTVRP